MPPEICDAYATLNTTMDTYSLGLVLYQVFNNGALPFDSEASRKAMMEQGEPLPPPAYADYEMAEIILKACAFAPEDRWKDPIEMGHALIAYMQRNAVNDVPIIPPVVEVTPAEDDEDAPQESPDAELSEDAEAETEVPEDTPDEDAPDEDAEDEGADENVSSEEEPQPDTDAPESEASEDWIDRMGTILDEDSTEIRDALAQGYIAYVINTRDVDSMGSANDGALIRRFAIENNVTVMTSLDTVKVLLDVLEETTLTISTIDS